MNAQELTTQYAAMHERMEALKSNSVSLQLDLGKASDWIDVLRKDKEEANVKSVAQEQRLNDALRRIEVVETRYWWLFTVIFVALLGLIATLIVALVKR